MRQKEQAQSVELRGRSVWVRHSAATRFPRNCARCARPAGATIEVKETGRVAFQLALVYEVPVCGSCLSFVIRSTAFRKRLHTGLFIGLVLVVVSGLWADPMLVGALFAGLAVMTVIGWFHDPFGVTCTRSLGGMGWSFRSRDFAQLFFKANLPFSFTPRLLPLESTGVAIPGIRWANDGAMDEVFLSFLENDQAHSHFEQVLDFFRKMGDRSLLGAKLNNVAAAHHGCGKYEQALSYYEQALVCLREVGDRSVVGSTLSNMGLAYHCWGKHGEARRHYEQAGAIFGLLGMTAQEEEVSGAIDSLLR